MTDLGALTRADKRGRRASAACLATEAIDEDLPPRKIPDVMTVAMEAIGGRIQRSEIASR